MGDTAAAGKATTVGMILLLAMVRADSGVWTWVPGLPRQPTDAAEPAASRPAG